MPADSVSGESSFCIADGYLIAMSSQDWGLGEREGERSISSLLPSLNSYCTSAPTLITSFNLNYLLKILSADTLIYWVSSFQHVNLAGLGEDKI